MADEQSSHKNNSGESFDEELQRLDRLLKRGVNDVSDIEIEEFTSGKTFEEIEQQFSSDGSLHIERSEYSTARKFGDITISDNVQYIVENNRYKITDIPLQEVEPLKGVHENECVAYCTMDVKNTDTQKHILGKYDKEFQDISGITLVNKEDKVLLVAAREGKVVVFKNLIYIVAADADATCVVRVTPDGMNAFADFIPYVGNGNKLSLTGVLDVFEKNDVIAGIDRGFISECIEQVNEKKCPLNDIKVARGVAPVKGQDAQIRFHCPMEAPDVGFRIRPDGTIDYRKQAPIQMVKEGALLATVSDPGKGVDGRTVTGKVIAAPDGEPLEIIEGHNVRISEEENAYYATSAGMISFHDNVLDVFPHYQVNGDVDMRSGNIDFNGSVSVMGNVQPGFEIKAAGDVSISGSVEAANIESGRDVRISGAIVGGNSATVKAGRNVSARHIQNATVEAQGDVIVVKSIMHSIVYSTGKVYLRDNAGSIVGGMVSALRGIEAMSIGSHMGTHTEVVTGSDYLLQRKRAEIEGVITFNKNNINKIDTVLKPLMAIIKKGVPLGADKKKRLKMIVDKRKSLIKQVVQLNHRMSMLSVEDPTPDSTKVIAQNTLYTDVVIKIVNATFKTTDSLKSVVCSLDLKENKVMIKSIRGKNNMET